jgi:hypothetical protein
VDSTNITIRGCTAHRPMEHDGFAGLLISNSHGIRVLFSDVEILNILNCSNLSVTDNHVLGYYQQTGTSYATILNNNIEAYPVVETPATLALKHGMYNDVLANHIDGKWDGQALDRIGTDDGIVLMYEDHDKISNNVIQNVWDAGIESEGLLSNTLIEGNQIQSAQETAIGAYVDTGWINNVVSTNQVVNSTDFIDIVFNSSTGPVFNVDLGLPPPTTLFFQSNTIGGNVFSSPRHYYDSPGQPSTAYGSSININFDNITIPLAAGGNIITGNVLPTFSPGPTLTPPSIFIDGGGNVCGPLPSGSPITCH